MLSQIILLISATLIYSISLMLVAFGGMFSERSGVINIGLEGTMVTAAFTSIIMLNKLNAANLNPVLVVIITILTAIIVGMIYSLLLAVVCINFKADQTLIGTALNLIATAIAMISVKRVNEGTGTELKFSKTSFVFKIGELELNIFLIIGIILFFVTIVVLYSTKFGKYLRTCGENPASADSVGINVYKYRYSGVLISGAFAGLGALAYILPFQQFWNANNGVAGFGFLALAVMIFGQWKPTRILIVSLIFALLYSFSALYDGIFRAMGLPVNTKILTRDLFRMIPFIASLILLAFSSKKSRAPKAEGIPYDKGGR